MNEKQIYRHEHPTSAEIQASDLGQTRMWWE